MGPGGNVNAEAGPSAAPMARTKHFSANHSSSPPTRTNTRGKSKLDVIDLTREEDQDMYIPDNDVVVLDSPPPNMIKFTNANQPIDLDGDEGGTLQRYTPEENELRRMLMMDHDLVGWGQRRKRKASEEAEGSGRARVAKDTGIPSASTNVDHLVPVTQTDPPSIDALVAQILAVIPDMSPIYALQELQRHVQKGSSHALDRVLAKAFDNGYTKATKEIVAPGSDEKYVGKIYRADKRKGEWYQIKSMSALEEAFPTVPVQHIREVHNAQSLLFGPSYMALLAGERAHVKAYVPLKRGRLPTKGKNAMPEMDEGGVEFELEKNWILEHAATQRAAEAIQAAKEAADAAEIAAGNGVECGCCFGDDLPANMYQCPSGHLFCKECCIRHAETKLGDEIHEILCMDTSGCQAKFADTELTRALPLKSLELLHRLRLAQELEDAAIEGLETCPSCPWAIVIDNPEEKLFRCMNEACGKVSCRQCRKNEHLPKSCVEYAAECKADQRHAVEDAMSEALIRKCPKCAKPYIKDSGCNKIRCVKCQTQSCYICQKIVNGYDHFNQTGPTKPGSCSLWDREEAQHDVNNVIAARDTAIHAQQVAAVAQGLEIDEDDLAVEAPVVRPGQHHHILHGHMHAWHPFGVEGQIQIGLMPPMLALPPLPRIPRPPGVRGVDDPPHLVQPGPNDPAPARWPRRWERPHLPPPLPLNQENLNRLQMQPPQAFARDERHRLRALARAPIVDPPPPPPPLQPEDEADDDWEDILFGEEREQERDDGEGEREQRERGRAQRQWDREKRQRQRDARQRQREERRERLREEDIQRQREELQAIRAIGRDPLEGPAIVHGRDEREPLPGRLARLRNPTEENRREMVLAGLRRAHVDLGRNFARAALRAQEGEQQDREDERALRDI